MSNVSSKSELSHSVDLLERILFKGAFLDLLLRDLRNKTDHEQKRARTERQLFGVIEQYISLTWLLNQYAKKPIEKLPYQLQCILLLAAYRLEYEASSPDYAVVNEHVKLVQGEIAWAKAMVNGVLRNYCRGMGTHAEKLSKASLSIQANIPDFWLDSLTKVLPGNELEAAVHGLNQQTPLDVTTVLDPALAVKLLQNSNILFEQFKTYPHIFRITGNTSAFWQIQEDHSAFVIQDLSITTWLASIRGELKFPLLDPFCAPGGKLLQVARWFPEASIYGSDQSDKRLDLVRNEISRLQLPTKSLKLTTSDALALEFSTQERFATIIADVPCSASGTLPRHPDVKLRNQVEDLDRLQSLQLQLLTHLSQYVDDDGVLYYSTCSLFPEENEFVVDHFLNTHTEWKRLEQVHPLTNTASYVLRYWPHQSFCNGFTVQKLAKK